MSILDEIAASKREHIAACKQVMPENALLLQVKSALPIRPFMKQLKDRVQKRHYGLIAEIKKASPSAGVIRKDFHVAKIAAAYEEGGAACLSVLTDVQYFQGHDDYILQAKKACKLPVLRKDFMLEPYQIIESRVLGADCVLLIMTMLSDRQAGELMSTARHMGMDALVEVHDAKELERALHMGPDMIGINNRNLKTMKVDLATAESLAAKIPKTCLKVCESGLTSHNDLRRMEKSGIAAFLVGESLMRSDDIAKATRALLGHKR